MKKILLSIGVVALTTISYAQTDTLKMILDTYFENIGGRENWEALNSYKISAEVDGGGMMIPIEMYRTKEGHTITKFSFQGMEGVQGAFDGEVAWGTNFMTMKPEKSDAEETENIKRESQDFPDPFLNYESKGYKAEYIGKEIVDGVDCYKVKLTKKPQLVDGEDVENVEFFFFDQENFVPVQTESEMLSGEMKGEIAVTVFSDYNEVGGLVYMPHSVTYKTKGGEGQTIEFDSIELNPDIPEGFFSFPTEE